MNKLKKIFKDDPLDFLFILISGVFPFFLFSNKLLGIFPAAMSLLLGFFFLFKERTIYMQKEKELASFLFFSSFIRQINNQHGLKESYDDSCRYLIGYQNIVPYEEIKEQGSLPFSLDKYSSYFDLIIKEDKNNEAHILNYHYLIKETEENINKKEIFINNAKKQKSNNEVLILLIYIFLVVLTNCFSGFQASLSNNFYIVIGSLVYSFAFPLTQLISFLSIKGENGNA